MDVGDYYSLETSYNGAEDENIPEIYIKPAGCSDPGQYGGHIKIKSNDVERIFETVSTIEDLLLVKDKSHQNSLRHFGVLYFSVGVGLAVALLAGDIFNSSIDVLGNDFYAKGEFLLFSISYIPATLGALMIESVRNSSSIYHEEAFF